MFKSYLGINWNMHKIHLENLNSFGRRSYEKERKNTLVAQVVYFQMRWGVEFSSIISVRNYLSLKIYVTTIKQLEPFLTMFYTINSSPLLVTK